MATPITHVSPREEARSVLTVKPSPKKKEKSKKSAMNYSATSWAVHRSGESRARWKHFYNFPLQRVINFPLNVVVNKLVKLNIINLLQQQQNKKKNENKQQCTDINDPILIMFFKFVVVS